MNFPLPPGYRFGSLEVIDVLDKGGTGIVYRVLNHGDGKYLTIKEYLPAMLAQRDATQVVRLRNATARPTYEKGLQCFLQGAMVAKELSSPWLLKGHDLWQANNTGYYSAPLYQGKTLQALVTDYGRLNEMALRRLLMYLCSALHTMHSNGYVHGDVCADNILLQDNHEPLILDLGSVRKILPDPFWHTQKALRPGYAPIEQYFQGDAHPIGPWTDIYALGALMHLLLVGELPVVSLSRTIEDQYLPLAQQHIEGVSDVFLKTIDRTLSINIEDRLQSVEQLLNELALPMVLSGNHDEMP